MYYRRSQQAGACYFFTLVTHQRQPLFTEKNIDRLRLAFQREMQKRPFSIDAIVILPDHLHTLWQLPEHDSNYSLRWSNIKRFFSIGYEQSVPAPEISKSHLKKREKSVWQCRFGNIPSEINKIGKNTWITSITIQ
jgi:putative transposase